MKAVSQVLYVSAMKQVYTHTLFLFHPAHSTHTHTASLPEANVEEVLESLRLRIRSMFKWAKSEVAGFDDLSPLDQKALLRRTVAELVMLGFARGSIAYESMYNIYNYTCTHVTS